ncbi:MAG: glycine zipper domain-containing protein [Cocleimonas sp.]|nr:glycine zipper domain-containing protein [Cocleimonas sp.]
MKKNFLLLFTLGVLTLSGCSNNAGTGAVIGSLVGAGIGKSTANHSDERAVIGAVVGGMVGAAIGSEKDRNTSSAGNNSYQSYASRPQTTYVNRPYYVRPARVTISTNHYGRRPYGYYNRHPNRYRPHRRHPHRGHGHHPHRFR